MGQEEAGSLTSGLSFKMSSILLCLMWGEAFYPWLTVALTLMLPSCKL